jgi:probable addiction module antidote protein
MTLKTTRWETTDYLKTPEARAAYLEAALQENDPAFFQHALGTVARAQGMQDIAGKSQTTRAGLYKALSSEGNPEFATVLRVVNALGYRLAIVRKKKPVANAKSKVPIVK